jgi:hypothetical protein
VVRLSYGCVSARMGGEAVGVLRLARLSASVTRDAVERLGYGGLSAGVGGQVVERRRVIRSEAVCGAAARVAAHADDDVADGRAVISR